MANSARYKTHYREYVKHMSLVLEFRYSNETYNFTHAQHISLFHKDDNVFLSYTWQTCVLNEITSYVFVCSVAALH